MSSGHRLNIKNTRTAFKLVSALISSLVFTLAPRVMYSNHWCRRLSRRAWRLYPPIHRSFPRKSDRRSACSLRLGASATSREKPSVVRMTCQRRAQRISNHCKIRMWGLPQSGCGHPQAETMIKYSTKRGICRTFLCPSRTSDRSNPTIKGHSHRGKRKTCHTMFFSNHV